MTTSTRQRRSADGEHVADLAPIDLDASAQRLTNFSALVQTLRATPQVARSQSATELNELLIAMRAPGHEAEESELVLELLSSKLLDGLVDEDGRSCRNEAVETMLSSGFPHALALDPADVAFARSWSASKGTEQPLADWELVLLRNRRRGAAAIVIGQVLGLLLTIRADVFRQWPTLTVGLFVLTIISAAVLGVARPRSSNVGVMGGTLTILCLMHLLVFGSTAPSLGLGVSFGSLLLGLLVALGSLEKKAPPDPDEPYWGPRGPPTWWNRGGDEDPLPDNDPWGRTISDWNHGREPTYGEKVPNPKGDFWKLWECKQ